MAVFNIYRNRSYANPWRLDHPPNAWRLNGVQRQPAEFRPRLNGPLDVVRAGGVSTAASGRKPLASMGSSAKPCRRARARSTGRAHRVGGGAPAIGRRPHCVRSPHIPAPLSPIRWTKLEG